jgi:phosphoglucomutase
LANGGPAPEAVTNKIFEFSKTLTSYKIADIPEVDISTIGTKTYGSLEIEIIDPVKDYLEMLKDIFDFDLIKKFFAHHKDFKVLFDALSGVTGPYGKAIFEGELGLQNSTQNCIPSPDFNGGHPDPNLTYAHSLVEAVDKNGIHFGAASDGDGDRNMIYGANAFVSPGDSLAIIAHHANVIPYFKKQGVYGLARSMPTSGAVDLVAKAQGLNCYEVPTGWKFFCALFDADKLSICGEESFGTGSNHIREKDGLWAVVAWLNIIAAIGEEHPDVTPSISKIQHDFWNTYGRTFFTRYDYENVDSEGAAKVVKDLTTKIADKSFIGSKVGGRLLILVPARGSWLINTVQIAPLVMPATSSTRISTAALARTKASTSNSTMEAASLSAFPALAVAALLSVSTSRNTPTIPQPMHRMPRTSWHQTSSLLLIC